MTALTVHKANAIRHDDPIGNMSLVVGKYLPDGDMEPVFEKDAKAIASALRDSLPQATLERLMCLLFQMRFSGRVHSLADTTAEKGGET